MTRRNALTEGRGNTREVPSEGLGRKTLSLLLSLAMALALVPAQAAVAIAEELDAIGEEQAAEGVSSEAGAVSEEGSAVEGEAAAEEPAGEEATKPSATAPRLRGGGGMLKAPGASYGTLAYELASDDPAKDGIYQYRTITLSLTASSDNVLTTSDYSSNPPVVRLTYKDLDGVEKTDTVYPSYTIVDDTHATFKVVATSDGTYTDVAVDNVLYESGRGGCSVALADADQFKVMNSPGIGTIKLIDANGAYVRDDDDSTKDFDLTEASGTVVKDARGIEVTLTGMLSVAAKVKDSDSYVNLVDASGTIVAQATFKQDSVGVYKATITRQGDNSEELAADETAKALPDGPLGFQIFAKDQFGTWINSDHYAVLEADKVTEEGVDKVKANGQFVLDTGSPEVVVSYPHDDRVTSYASTTGMVHDRPTGSDKTDFFNQGVEAGVLIYDQNLDMNASTVDGFTLREIVDSSAGLTVDGATYTATETTNSSTGSRYVAVAINYADGVYETPVVHVKDGTVGHAAVDYAVSTDASYDNADHLIVDTQTPEITGADIYTDGNLVDTVDDNGHHVAFFTDETYDLALYVTEPYGIRSIEFTDTSGRYGLASTADAEIDAVNADVMTGGGGTYNLVVVDKLAEGTDLSDGDTAAGTGVTIKLTDFAGNSYTWSLDKDGHQTTSTGSSAVANGNVDVMNWGIAGLEHPSIVVVDTTAPDISFSPAIESSGSVSGYERYLSSGQTTTMTVVERNLRFLHGFTGGDSVFDGYGDIDGTYAALDESRTVAIVKYTAPDGSVSYPTVTVSDLTAGSDGKTYTYDFDFSQDGVYELTASLTDVVGLIGTASIEQFVVDATAPVLTVEYDNNDVRNGTYYKATRTATVTVVEHNFDPNLFTVEAKLVAGTAKGGTADPTVSSWTSTGDTHTCTVAFVDDGTYTFEVSGKDMAGNEATPYDLVTFTIDTETPTIGKYVDAGTADASKVEIDLPEPAGTYGSDSDKTYFYAGSVELDARIKDRTFNESEATVDGASVAWTSSGVDVDGYATYGLQDKLQYTADGEYQTPAIVTTDMAGNTTRNDDSTDAEHYNIRSFVIDLEAPTVEVAIDRSPSSQGFDGSGDPYNFYNTAGTTLTITVKDGHALNEVKLDDPDGNYGTITWNKNPLGEKEVVGTVTPLFEPTETNDAEFDRAIILTATDIAGNQRTWSIDHTGTVTQVSGPSADNAAINGEHPVLLVQDTTAPEISLTGVDAGTYYNTPQTVVATVTELLMNYLQQFDAGRTFLTVTKHEANAGRAASSWTIPVSSLSGSAPTYVYSEFFGSDGHYALDAQLTDFAGNASATISIGEFTIDTTPPQLTMEFDNNDVRNEKYYKAPRTATITVVEHNFDPSLFNIETTGQIGGWSNNGDTHVCTVYFGEGGPYTIKVNGKDLAGNEAIEVSEPEFIVDLTAPEIEIAGTAQRLGFVGAGGGLVNAYHDKLEDQSAYNGVVVPTITYKDNEVLSAADLGHTLSGSKLGDEIEHESSVSPEDKEMTVTLRDMGYVGPGAGDGSNWEAFYVDDYDVNADDIYTIKATMTDQAGNEAEAELTFSVNRYGSNYDVRLQGMSDEELEEYERSGMLSEAPTIVVREVNVSGVADRDKDGNIVPDNHHVEKEFANATTAIRLLAGEGSGYDLSIVDPKRAENGWSEYVYTVRSANFGEGSDSDHNDRGQGVYRVNVMSDDTSSNANTTADYWGSDSRRTQVTATGATAEFILDELAPSIDELDLPQHLSRGSSFEASFHVTDDITSGNTVEVQVDGVTLDAREVRGPGNGVGTFTFEIPGKAFNWHRSVKIVVRDYAGREVTASNDGWIWQSSFVPEGLTVAGALAVVVAGAVYARKRREAAEPELPM